MTSRRRSRSSRSGTPSSTLTVTLTLTLALAVTLTVALTLTLTLTRYTKLNLLELTDAQKQAIVDEGNLVFALNIEVFEELEGNPVQALWTLATASLRSALGLKD